MKKGWEAKPLLELADFYNGLWKGEKPPFTKVGVIRNTNFCKDGSLDDSDIAYLDVETKKLSTRKLEKGDIVLEKSGGGPKQPVGRVALFEGLKGTYSFSNFTSAIRVKNPDQLYYRYLHLFLYEKYISGITESMQSHSTGIRNLDGDAYKGIVVNFPPLPEQKRIVSVLDKAFAAIATAKENAEKNLANARELYDGYLARVFSGGGKDWELKTVRDLAEYSLGKMLDKAKNKGNLQKYLRNMNVRWFEFDLSDLSEMKILEAEKERYLIKKGDVVICEGGYPGRAAIWDEDATIYFQKALHRVRFHEPKLNEWFLYFLYSQNQTGELRTHFTGTGIQHFTGEALGKYEIPVPPKKQLVSEVSKFEKLKTESERLEGVYQRRLAEIEVLKKSILQKAFAGELRGAQL